MVVGQERLCRIVDDKNIDTFPKSLILVGNKGSGKSLMINYIATKLGLQIIDITSRLDYETINVINTSPIPYIYKIDSYNISIKDQNIILKFLEEPLNNAFIIIECRSTDSLLTTVINRCQLWTLDEYSKDCLVNNFDIPNEFVEFVDNPGEWVDYHEQPFSELKHFCDLVVNKIDQAPFENSLKIVDKLFDEKLNYNKDLFLKLIKNRYLSNCKVNYTFDSRIIKEINALQRKLDSNTIDKYDAVLSFIANYWGVTHET